VFCEHRLRAAPEVSDVAAAMLDKMDAVDIPGPQRCAYHPGGMHCPDECNGRLSDSPGIGQPDLEERNTSSSLGPASVDEMDEAMRDVERRQLDEQDDE